MRTHTSTHTQTHVHTLKHKHVHAQILTHSNTAIHTCTSTHLHLLTNSHTHTHTRTHTHAHTHARTHTRTRAHTHTHTGSRFIHGVHSQAGSFRLFLSNPTSFRTSRRVRAPASTPGQTSDGTPTPWQTEACLGAVRVDRRACGLAVIAGVAAQVLLEPAEPSVAIDIAYDK